VRTSEETPSLGVNIGRRFSFESLRRNGDGPKEAIHTAVVTGRSAADDPKSLIVFYRSHLGMPSLASSGPSARVRRMEAAIAKLLSGIGPRSALD
jgi:hypothetical protein